MSMYEEEIEYDTPAKYLVDRDPILFGRLSIREAAQWSVFLGIIYLIFNYLPVEFTYRLIVGSLVVMAGYAAIHQPINGLTGYEWLRVALRFNGERKQHEAAPAVGLGEMTNRKPAFFVSVELAPEPEPELAGELSPWLVALDDGEEEEEKEEREEFLANVSSY